MGVSFVMRGGIWSTLTGYKRSQKRISPYKAAIFPHTKERSGKDMTSDFKISKLAFNLASTLGQALAT
jgi:hypothetical protein